MGPSSLEFQGATKTEGPKSSDTQGPSLVGAEGHTQGIESHHRCFLPLSLVAVSCMLVVSIGSLTDRA